MYKRIHTIASLGLIAAMLAILAGPLAHVARAAALTSLSDTMSTIKASTAANHEILFASPTGIVAGQTVTYTFNTFTMGTVAFGDIDFATGSTGVCSSATYTEQTLAATASGATWGAAVAGTVLTITSGTGTATAGNCIRLRVGTNAVTGGAGVNRITNPAASSPTITMAGTFGDTGTITINIIANDQVSVSGTVNQSITFSISAATIAFGTLDAAAARFANTTTGSATEVEAHTLIAGTNAGSGYTITVQGATLTSGAFTITAIGSTNTASAVGTKQFGLRITATGGTGTVTAPYAAAGFAYAGTATVTSQVASATGASANTTYSVRYLANITSNTEAATYTATLTYVATGNF